MSSFVIEDGKTEFFYTDSGSPGREMYTTLVAVHGNTFHSGAFQRIQSLASSRGLRLICPHRRDYTGTTLYSAGELRVLAEGTETERAAFLKSRGIELAQFLNGIIDALSLPAPTSEGSDGGIALLGWSLGNTCTLATIAAVDSLSTDMQHRLQTYLRKLILHEPPSLCLGLDDPPQRYYDFEDPKIPEEERGAALARWVSSYYTHGNLYTHDLNNLNYREADSSRQPTITNMTPEEFASAVDVAPGPRSEVFFFALFKGPFSEQTKKALFDPATRSLWPKMDALHMYGDSSPWNVIHAAWELEKQAKAFREDSLKFSVIKGANHFVFWDEPVKAIDALATYLRT